MLARTPPGWLEDELCPNYRTVPAFRLNLDGEFAGSFVRLRGLTRVNDVVVRAGVLQPRLTGHDSMLEDPLSIVKNH